MKRDSTAQADNITAADVPLDIIRKAMVAAGVAPEAAARWNPLPESVSAQDGDSPALRIDGIIVSSTGERLDRLFFGESYGIGPITVADFLKEAGGKDVVLLINSPGGAVTGGADIASQIKMYPGKVTAKIVGEAASCGSLIAAACDSVQVGPMSMVMIHAPWASMAGNAVELRKEADVLDKLGANFAEVYAERMDRDTVTAWMEDGEDHWMTSAECLESKFADGKIDFPKGKDTDSDDADSDADADASAKGTPPAAAKADGDAEPPAGEDAPGNDGGAPAGDPPGGDTEPDATADGADMNLLLATALMNRTPKAGDCGNGKDLRSGA